MDAGPGRAATRPPHPPPRRPSRLAPGRAKRFEGLGGHVKIFSRDPDLLEALPRELAEELTARISVPTLSARPGAWDAPARRPAGVRALLVLDGLLTRQVCLGRRGSVELLGQGDVLGPWLESADMLPSSVHWHIELPTTLAVLDADFLRTAVRHDAVIAALMDRLLLRSRRLAEQAALTSVCPMEERVLGGLWYVAARWGKVTPTGVRIPLPLTHRLIAAVVGATRPTVSSAIAELARRGVAERDAGGWVLHDGLHRG